MATAQDLIDRVWFLLQDEGGVRWPAEEILRWLNEGQVVLAAYPGAYTQTTTVDLSEGTRQQLPDDTWILQSISRNVDDYGVPLSPVRLVTRQLLDSYAPDWHMEDEEPLVENYVYDDREPSIFWVYPPNDGTGHVEVTYSGIPADMTSVTDTVAITDPYIPALVDYAVYRCQSKDSDYAPGSNIAQAFFNSASVALQVILQQRGQVTPNAAMVADTPVNPNGGTE